MCQTRQGKHPLLKQSPLLEQFRQDSYLKFACSRIGFGVGGAICVYPKCVSAIFFFFNEMESRFIPKQKQKYLLKMFPFNWTNQIHLCTFNIFPILMNVCRKQVVWYMQDKCLSIYEIYAKPFGSFTTTIVSLILEILPRKVNIIPKYNFWLAEAAKC